MARVVLKILGILTFVGGLIALIAAFLLGGSGASEAFTAAAGALVAGALLYGVSALMGQLHR
jgi:hypothetical protein